MMGLYMFRSLEGDRAVFKGGFNVGAFMRRISSCVAYRGLATLGL